MSFNEIVDTLNRQGHHFSIHRIPRDSFAVEVADMFGYFEAHTCLGSDSSDRICARKQSSRQPDLWGFGDGKRAFLWIKQGKPDPVATHWGFVAENAKKVDEFYKAAMSSGATDNISPRARLEYYPGYYAADAFDPDGYSFEVVHKANSAIDPLSYGVDGLRSSMTDL